MSAPEDSEALSVRGSVRKLFAHALANPTDTALDSITRTVKFRVRDDERLKRELNRHFDAADTFRRRLAADLERMFTTAPADFFAIVEASSGKPYEDKNDCKGWLLTKYITGRGDLGVISDISMAVVAELASTLKSFSTRRKNVAGESKSTLDFNARLWSVNVRGVRHKLLIFNHANQVLESSKCKNSPRILTHWVSRFCRSVIAESY